MTRGEPIYGIKLNNANRLEERDVTKKKKKQDLMHGSHHAGVCLGLGSRRGKVDGITSH